MYETDYNVMSGGVTHNNSWFSAGNADEDGMFENQTTTFTDARESGGAAVINASVIGPDTNWKLAPS